MGVSDGIESDLGSGLSRELRDKEAFASELSKGPPVSPEDQSRSTLHTGEREEGSAVAREHTDGAQLREGGERATESGEPAPASNGVRRETAVDPVAAPDPLTDTPPQNITETSDHGGRKAIQSGQNTHEESAALGETTATIVATMPQIDPPVIGSADARVFESSGSGQTPSDAGPSSAAMAEGTVGTAMPPPPTQDHIVDAVREELLDIDQTDTDATPAETEHASAEVAVTNEAPTGLTLSSDTGNLVRDGSFESFALDTGRWSTFRDDSSDVWDSSAGIEVWDHLGGTHASDGDQHLEMDAGHGVDSIGQTIQTSKGQVYDLGVDLRERLTNGTDTVEVYWNDTLVAELNPDSTDWTTYDMQVIGTGEDRLELRETAGENDTYGALVDNITLTSVPNVIAENVSGAVVGELSFVDPDGDGNHSYAVSDDRFEIVDNILRLKETAALDFEDASSVDVSVTVTDSGGLSTSETFTIGVVDTADLSISTGFQARYFDVDQRLTSLDDIQWGSDPTHSELIPLINYENGRGSFWQDGSKDTFGVEISGAVQVDEGGTYRFDLGGDDGAQLIVNGQLVIDNDGLHAYQTKSGELHLEPGTHHIEVRYFENYGHAGLRLEWEGPGMEAPELVMAPDMAGAQTVSGMPIALNITHPHSEPGVPTDLAIKGLPPGTTLEAGGKVAVAGDDGRADVSSFDTGLLTITPPYDFTGEIDAILGMSVGGAADISQSILVTVGKAQIAETAVNLVTGFRAEYFDVDHRIGRLDDVNWDADPTHQDHQSSIDFENSRDSFWEEGSKDTFAARFQGQITVEEGGVYTFYTSADDGVVVYVNGQEVVKDDGTHRYRSDSGQIELDPGVHDIEVKYFENYGHAGLRLEWDGPDLDGRQLVQADQDIAIDVNGTLEVGLAFETTGQDAFVGIEGLPPDTIVVSGDAALVTDGGPTDLTGWNLNALEISPPPGFQGAIHGEITLFETAFNGAPVSSSSEFTINVGDLGDDLAHDFPVDDAILRGDNASVHPMAAEVAWDAVADHDQTSGGEPSQSDVMADPVLITDGPDIAQIATETYERLDW